MTSAPTRRERLRAATMDEIHATARRLLVSDGQAGVTLRAIGREMGMTAPALYRYYDSLDTLLIGLCAALYDECAAHITAVVQGIPADRPAARLVGAARAYRSWSVAHPAEFTLMFASAKAAEPDPVIHAAGMRFATGFLQLFLGVWQERPFPVPDPAALPGDLAEQLAAFVAGSGVPLPVGAVQVFLSCWIRLYGMVALEVFGHLHFCVQDADSLFEAEMATVAGELGISLAS